jgi:hypothetical protein
MHFWVQDLLIDGLPLTGIIKLLAFLGVIAFGVLYFRRRPAALIGWLAGTCGLAMFYYSRYFGLIRHQGFLFMLFICFAWLAPYAAERARNGKIPAKLLTHILTAILAVHVLGAGVAAAVDWQWPFSQGKAAAEYLRSHNLQDDVLVGHEDFAASTVSGYLDRPIYYPRIGRFGTFLVHDNTRLIMPAIQDVLAQGKILGEAKKQSTVFILNAPLAAELQAQFGLKHLADFEPAIQEDECIYLYVMPAHSQGARDE